MLKKQEAHVIGYPSVIYRKPPKIAKIKTKYCLLLKNAATRAENCQFLQQMLYIDRVGDNPTLT